ncbi:ATP-binding protein [Syntrophus aciditrophicus]|uniref:Hypothetical cytosolic protein n=1 Tax=Syntrophus aciditrophicus (strain SB) TaxID=56780 RepID=Q2LUZ9_SYNAS|nr:ATP-binding protein [Syntrophus aciditrophicus]ABC77905.1 hypothetical cytosolic protein [Syntrophus aciditrophicus SB]
MNDLPRLKIGNDKETYMSKYIEDRYTHTLLMGKSGTGKSTLIMNWWEEDNYWKNAKILIDPSGFLAGDCYSISRGMYSSLNNPIPINPMKVPYTPDQIAESIREAVNQVVTITTPNQLFTVKMIECLDLAIKECLKNNRLSLLSVRDYIANMRGNAETRDGILARLNYLLSDPKMEKMLCGKNSLNIGEIIRNRKTFILDCFGMGREKMIFMGSLVNQAVKNYFRYEKHAEYQPLALYIDECHNFLNPNMLDILKEGRKYKLSCVLSTQDFAVIPETMTRVMLNVGNIVSYRLGHREASYVAKELDIEPQTLQFIEKYHVGYMTPKERGIAKAPRPPIFTAIKPPKKAVLHRKSRPSWFTAESYQAA